MLHSRVTIFKSKNEANLFGKERVQKKLNLTLRGEKKKKKNCW